MNQERLSSEFNHPGALPLGFPAFRTVRNRFPWLISTQSVAHCYSSLNGLGYYGARNLSNPSSPLCPDTMMVMVWLSMLISLQERSMTEDPHHGISRSVIIVYLMVSYPRLKVFLSIPLSTVPGTQQELVKYLFRE